MAAFNAYLKKEVMESSRQYRYIILAAGIIIFAILDPLMLKVLPVIMKNQIPVDIGSLMVISQKAAVLNYIKDLYQIGSIVIVFVIGSSLSDEIKSQRLVFPYSSGCSPAGLVLAKAVHFGITIAVLISAGFLINYYYSGMLFTGEPVKIQELAVSVILIIIYFIFITAVTLLLSSLVKKGIAAGFISLALSYISLPFADMEGIGNFIPYKLVQRAGAFSFDGASSAIILALLLAAVFIIITVHRMKKTEVI